MKKGKERGQRFRRTAQRKIPYRLLFEANPLPAWVFDAKTLKFLAVNKAAIHHYGYSRREFLAMTIKGIRPPEEIPALLRYLAHAGPGLRMAGCWKHQKKDGTIIDVEVFHELMTWQGKRAYLVLAHDVTERKRSEEELQKTEERYRLLVENNPAFICTHDLDGRVLSTNLLGARMLGYEPDELVGTDIRQHVAPSARHLFDNYLERVRRDGQATGLLRVVTKSGEERVWVYQNVRCEGPRGRDCVLGTAQDITEQRKLEGRLRQAQKMEAVGRLAGGIAHDFNNLLTAILGRTEMLTRGLPEGVAWREEIVQIQKAAVRGAALVRRLLTFSRKEVISPKILDVNDVVTEAERMLRPLIGEDITLALTLHPGLGRVKADPVLLEEALLNLVINARDAMPKGGKLTIETKNVVLNGTHSSQPSWAPAGQYVLLAVSDTGTGIDRNARPHLFEPFFTTKEAAGGTGLGLSSVYGIVRQSGGHIRVYSEPGHGSTFKIYLPVVYGVGEPRVLGEDHPPPTGTETVLLVEDEASVREAVGWILESLGYKVLKASNGAEAIQIARLHNGEIHLLFTDVVMPGMSGRELAERLQARLPTLRVVYTSGYTDDAIVRHGILHEDSAFLHKPFSRATLAQKVRDVLDRH